MKKIKIIIEKMADGHYWAYAENFEGINGGGSTIPQVKKSVKSCVEIQQELGNLKKGKYELIFNEPIN